ncbi:MAG: diguanylate cyclase protein [Clostridia bacterium]|jgi:diguanylate cyclase (GGDEF)-like protein|nr:diguanylate cyclase protein [Clostridia bacterium]
MKDILKFIKYLSLPMAVITTAALLFFNISRLPLSITLTIQYISYGFFIIGMLLSLRFNKSKVFFLCLILGISQLLLSNKTLITSDILAFLIPFNILLFSFIRERGIFTIWGKLKFLIIAVQFAFSVWLMQSIHADFRALMNHKIINFDFVDIIPISQMSVLLFLLVFIALSIKIYSKPTLMESSFIGVLIMVFIALLLKDNLLGLRIFYAMSGFLLILGVVETSYFMAYRDELTGIPARRALKESMLKLGGKYVIAMIDIDFFKKFNDTYGHDAGDEVLQMVASNLAQVGGGGKAFRFGGEEFTILFPNKTREAALPLLEELRKSVAKQKLPYKKKSKGKGKVVTKQLSVTISIGVAEKNESLKTSEEVLKAADKALYKAKKNGRNCVCK